MRHRCSACLRADGAIPLTKHFLTVKNDPYLVPLQYTKHVLDLNVLNSYDSLLDYHSINKIAEFCCFKKMGKCNCMGFFFFLSGICCAYHYESPFRDNSYRYPQHDFNGELMIMKPNIL